MDEKEYTSSSLLYSNIHNTHDRSGSRIHRELLILAYCELHGLKYIGALCDAMKGRAGPTYIENKSDYPSCAKLLKLPKNISYEFAESQKKDYEVIFLDPTSEFRLVRKGYPDINELITPTIREKWIKRWWYDKKQNNEAISIVVHIRRGDICQEIHSNTRYLYNCYYMDILKSIISKIPDNYKITICSDSILRSANRCPSLTQETFDIFISSFPKNKIEINIDTDKESCWKCMIESDIFIMSRSSFSYPPAIFNKGIVIYHPFWWGKLNGWLNSKDKDFEKHLETRLSELTLKYNK